MNVDYYVGPDSVEPLPDTLLERHEALSLSSSGAGARPALHEALACLRLSVGTHLRIPRDGDLSDVVSRALVAAEVRAARASLSIGSQSFAYALDSDSYQERLVSLASEATEERERLLAEAGHPRIARRWPTREDCARLAHKFVAGMSYTYEDAASIIYRCDGFERPEAWSRQGLHRWVSEYDHRSERGERVRRPGRNQRPGAMLSVVVVMVRNHHAESSDRYTARFGMPALLVTDPQEGRPDIRDLSQLLTLGSVHTLYVTDPGLFASARQRQVVYALALHCGVRVVEGHKLVAHAAKDDDFNRLLMEGTQLSLSLHTHERATILEDTRSDAYRDKLVTDLRSSGASLAHIAERLNEEVIPTPRGSGRWHKSAVQKLLSAHTSGSA